MYNCVFLQKISKMDNKDIEEIKSLLYEIRNKIRDHKNYSLNIDDSKQIFLELYKSNKNINITDTSKQLKVSRKTLYNWIDKIKEEQL